MINATATAFPVRVELYVLPYSTNRAEPSGELAYGVQTTGILCAEKILAASSLAALLSIGLSTRAEANPQGTRAEHFRQTRNDSIGLSRREARESFRSARHDDGRGRHGVNAQTSLTVPLSTDVQLSRRDIRHNAVVKQDSLTIRNSGQIAQLDRGVNLDFGSAEKNIVLGEGLFGDTSSATISVE